MLDPLSVAGLTLAVFDQLLKLGERTAILVSDIKNFGENSERLHIKIVNENEKTAFLRILLFEAAAVYHGATLFEQFEEDQQDQVNVFLIELQGLLYQASRLLEKRYGTGTQITNALPSPPPLSGLTINEGLINRKQSKSPIMLLRWSLWDKKRVEKLVDDFAELNGRIHEKIKLWCLASRLGVNPQHLKRLKTTEASKRLGFDLDATLRLAKHDADSEDRKPLELPNEPWLQLLDSNLLQGRYGLFRKEKKILLQEAFPYESHAAGSKNDDLESSEVMDATMRRVDSLARILEQPKETIFRIPRCIGWKYLESQKQVSFVFEIGEDQNTRAVSLLKLLEDGEARVSLSDRMRLAYGLALCISQLHMVQWLHESFRSENVLFLPSIPSDSPRISANNIQYDQPWIMGFEFSRPEEYFTAGLPDFDPTRDAYRHPDRQGAPSKRFNKTHDIYALGVVLLEIGLWEPVLDLDGGLLKKYREPRSVQKRLLGHARQRLGSHMGDRYRDVVLKCLDGELKVGADREDLMLQQEFRTHVVDVLETLAKNI